MCNICEFASLFIIIFFLRWNERETTLITVSNRSTSTFPFPRSFSFSFARRMQPRARYTLNCVSFYYLFLLLNAIERDSVWIRNLFHADYADSASEFNGTPATALGPHCTDIFQADVCARTKGVLEILGYLTRQRHISNNDISREYTINARLV